MQTNGLHHVTAVADDPQETVDFYTEVLGLRLVKRTVNFDDTSTYHLYFGDETGTPGTAMTFFPFENARRGRPGKGQPTATAFAIPPGSVDYWVDRLDSYGVDANVTEDRFGETVLPLRDGDGQPLELVATESATETAVEPWSGGPVPAEHAIRGFHSVTLHSLDTDVTGSVLETLGYERSETGPDRVRYRVEGNHATVVDLLTRDGSQGVPGAGTVHHVAFRVPDDDAQAELAEQLQAAGQSVTPQKDRHYFRSVYFREPGGILMELATDGPGFTADEPVETLGSELRVPPWLDDEYERLAAGLTPLTDPTTGDR
ncbi:ring-cleaving dioxygenase [Haloarchaeobius sp. TZWWS8]|uniref:ring-cleaving dioxygenase n=1 Tax=Haloarchaeobius sp. TZWWS8 TaxID=3446121 RepID=UPI003EC0AE2E